jgi:hypothetical protein
MTKKSIIFVYQTNRRNMIYLSLVCIIYFVYTLLNEKYT